MKKQFFALIFLFTGTTVFSQEISYNNCNECWNPDSLGNHRAIVEFEGNTKIAKIIIPWRRRDEDPDNKRIIIQDEKTNRKILNVKAATLNREFGEIYFEPVSGSGTYYIYYMPYKNEGRSNYPKGVYLKPENTASEEWLTSVGDNKNISPADVKEIQSINAFNSFYPMEVIATKAEIRNIISANAAATYLVFPEDRMHPIKMTNDIPQRWIQKGTQNFFFDTVAKGENFTFQLGILALKQLQNVQIVFTDLVSPNGNKISSKNISCINTGAPAAS